ncbi:MAG TPA: hypothetical protein VG164_13610 [Trebonia sp.]|nr:hypothetical protein [Trebonia sp.]
MQFGRHHFRGYGAMGSAGRGGRRQEQQRRADRDGVKSIHQPVARRAGGQRPERGDADGGGRLAARTRPPPTAARSRSRPAGGRWWAGLAELAPPAPVTSLRAGTRANAVRAGRYCYDHLGGRLGVGIMRALLDRGALAGGDGRFHPERAVADRLSAAGSDLDYRLSAHGEAWVRGFGVDLDALRAPAAAHPLLHRLERAAAPSRRGPGRGGGRGDGRARMDQPCAERSWGGGSTAFHWGELRVVLTPRALLDGS